MGANTMPIHPAKKCPACGGTMTRTKAELTFERAGVQVIVQDVPVAACEACGEQYVPGSVGLALSDEVESVLAEMEARLGQESAVARPRSLVMQASERAELELAV